MSLPTRDNADRVGRVPEDLRLLFVPAAKGSRLFNVTCAVFKGPLGRACWPVIRPFHNELTEDWLASIRERAEGEP